MDQRDSTYHILATVQAAIGATLTVAVIGLYIVRPSSLRDVGLSQLVAAMGLVSLLYYLSVHQYLKTKHMAVSALVISAISTIDLALLIIATGGLDSPIYSFWLLVIVVAGLFGMYYTIGVLAVTTLFYFIVLIQHGFDGDFVSKYLVQFLVSIAAGIMAEYVYYRGRRVSAQSTWQMMSLSGQLSEEQLKAQAIMSNMADGVVVVDRNRQIQLFNQAAGKMTGWDPATTMGLDYRLVLGIRDIEGRPIDDSSDPFNAAWGRGSSLVNNNLSMVTRGGRNISLGMTISPIFDATRQARGAVAVFRDISTDKASGRQKDEFISTASHEMRTPIAAIEGYISLAMSPKVATIDERAKAYLLKAHESTQHLAELFHDLLSITKIEDSSLPKHMVPVDITKLLQSVVNDLQFSANKKNLSLTYTTPGPAQGGERVISPMYLVSADPERLREVVMNLVENSFKFTKQGGVTVSNSGDDKIVTVNIADSGIGIAAEDIPHLFQKFYRVDNSATRTIGGTGLGLYLCRAVIEAYNGRISVTSTQGKGSTFSFSLPRLANTEANLAAAAANGKPGGLQPLGMGPGAVPAGPVTAKPAPPPAPQPLPEQPVAASVASAQAAPAPVAAPTSAIVGTEISAPAAPQPPPPAPAPAPVATTTTAATMTVGADISTPTPAAPSAQAQAPLSSS